MIVVSIIMCVLMSMLYLFMGMLMAMLTHDFLIMSMGVVAIVMAMGMRVGYLTMKMPMIG